MFLQLWRRICQDFKAPQLDDSTPQTTVLIMYCHKLRSKHKTRWVTTCRLDVILALIIWTSSRDAFWWTVWTTGRPFRRQFFHRSECWLVLTLFPLREAVKSTQSGILFLRSTLSHTPRTSADSNNQNVSAMIAVVIILTSGQSNMT